MHLKSGDGMPPLVQVQKTRLSNVPYKMAAPSRIPFLTADCRIRNRTSGFGRQRLNFDSHASSSFLFRCRRLP